MLICVCDWSVPLCSCVIGFEREKYPQIWGLCRKISHLQNPDSLWQVTQGPVLAPYGICPLDLIRISIFCKTTRYKEVHWIKVTNEAKCVIKIILHNSCMCFGEEQPSHQDTAKETSSKHKNKTRKARINVTPRRVRAANLAVNNNDYYTLWRGPRWHSG